MLRSIAKAEGMVFEETLTGFKWMGNRSYDIITEYPDKTVLLAYEEAIGFMCGTRVLDKDGISAGIRAAELIAYLAKKNMTLLDMLNEIYDKWAAKNQLLFNFTLTQDTSRYGYHCGDTSYFMIQDFDEVPKVFNRLRNFDGKPSTVNIC